MSSAARGRKEQEPAACARGAAGPHVFAETCVAADLTDALRVPPQGGPAAAPGAGEQEITYLAWNPRVQHILSSTSASGVTIVWDLKKQRPVMSFRDPNRCGYAGTA